MDIGYSGSQSDGSVIASSFLGHAIKNDVLNIPKPSPLPYSEICLSLVFVGDNAFWLKENIMKPYTSRTVLLKKKCLIIDFKLE